MSPSANALEHEGFEGPLCILGEEAWEIAEESGWHGRVDTLRRADAQIIRLALIMSEASEGIEWVRKANPTEMGKELADIIIRTVEMAHIYGFELDEIVAEKMAYNRKRLDVPARDGGKAV